MLSDSWEVCPKAKRGCFPGTVLAALKDQGAFRVGIPTTSTIGRGEALGFNCLGRKDRISVSVAEELESTINEIL